MILARERKVYPRKERERNEVIALKPASCIKIALHEDRYRCVIACQSLCGDILSSSLVLFLLFLCIYPWSLAPAKVSQRAWGCYHGRGVRLKADSGL